MVRERLLAGILVGLVTALFWKFLSHGGDTRWLIAFAVAMIPGMLRSRR